MARRREPPRLELLPERKHANGSVERSVYVIKFFDEEKGRQATKSTGCGPEAASEAEKVFTDWMIERAAGQPLHVNSAVDEVSLAEVLSHFIEERIIVPDGSDVRPVSRPKEVLAYINDLILWWGAKTVGEVTKKSCRAYVKHCSTPGAAPNRLEYLRRAIRLAQEDELITAAPKVHMPPKAKPRQDIFEREDIARIIWYCLTTRRGYTHNAGKSKNTGKAGKVKATKARPYRHLVPYVLMATYTGTRSHRMFTASFVQQPGRPWIDLERGVFHRAAPGEDVASNKRAPSCKIPKRLLRHMRRWYRNGQRYPIEYNGAPIESSKALGIVIRRLFPDKKLVAHSFRHTAATWLMRRSELSVHDISGFLGISLEVLDEVYGKHRVSHHGGIDDAISTGGIGKIEREDPLDDGFKYDRIAPLDTMRNNSDQPKSTHINGAENAEKKRRAA